MVNMLKHISIQRVGCRSWSDVARTQRFGSSMSARRSTFVSVLGLVICLIGGSMSQAGPMVEAPLVDWSHALTAHRLIEGWVTAGKVDEEAEQVEIAVSGLSAVRVTLRWSGFVMGTGEVEVPAAAAKPGSASNKASAANLLSNIDLYPLVARATAAALADAGQSLTDSRTKGTQLAPTASNKGPANIAELGPLLQVDLQLACRLEPIRIGAPGNAPGTPGAGAGKANPGSRSPQGGDATEVMARFVPGYHGLRMTRTGDAGAGKAMAQGGAPGEIPGAGAIPGAWMWPGNAVAANVSPRSQLIQLLSELGYTAQDLDKIGRIGGPNLARFEVIHVVRPAADQPVTRLVRGSKILPATSLDTRTLDGMAQRLTRFLVKRTREDGVMVGIYHPVSDRYDPPTALRHEAALAAYALGRQAALLVQLRAPDAQILEAQQGAKKLIDPLIKNLLAEGRGDDPAAMALVVMTIVESPGMEDRKRERDQLVDLLMKMRSDDGAFRTGLGADAEVVPGPTQALIVASLASLQAKTRNATLGQMVRQSQALLWTRPEPAYLAAMVPWLVYGELKLRGTDDPADKLVQARNDARLKAIEAVSQAIQAKQVTEMPTDGPADVVGGFNLGEHPPEAFPAPDWRTAQMLAFTAAALREPGLTSPDKFVQRLLDCGLAARFVAQLMFDEPGCYFARGREQSMGGVRLSPWDNRVGPVAAAMALLGVTELQQSIANTAVLPVSP
jgi:hypothetical protein